MLEFIYSWRWTSGYSTWAELHKMRKEERRAELIERETGRMLRHVARRRLRRRVGKTLR